MNEQAKANIDKCTKELVDFVNVQSNVLLLLEYSKNYSNYICKSNLSSIFIVGIHFKTDDQIISDIFKLISNFIIDNENSLENSEFIIKNEFSIPFLVDSIDTSNAKRKIAALQILSKLATLHTKLMQKAFLINQERLVQLLTIINKEDKTILSTFLSIVPILVQDNGDFQLLFAFNLIGNLMEYVKNKLPFAISALSSLLYKNEKSQNLFLNNDNLKIIKDLLLNNDMETISLLFDLLKYNKTNGLREMLQETGITKIILENALNGSPDFIKLLGFLIQENKNLCYNLIDKLPIFFNLYIQNEDIVCLSIFFNSLLKGGFLEASKEIAKLTSSFEDRSNTKVIELSCLVMLSNNECCADYYENSSFLLSIIGYFISKINLEYTLNFLIVMFSLSHGSITVFLKEESEPLSFLIEFVNNSDFEPNLYIKCCILLSIICSKANLSLENINMNEIKLKVSNLKHFYSQRSKIKTLNKFMQKCINELILNESLEEEINNQDKNLNENNNIENQVFEKAQENEIKMLQKRIYFLEMELDKVNSSSQNELITLKSEFNKSEIMYKSEISRLKNNKHEQFFENVEKLQNQLNSLKVNIELLQTMSKDAINQQIEELQREKSNVMKIVNYNKELKFQISQLKIEKELFMKEYNDNNIQAKIKNYEQQIEYFKSLNINEKEEKINNLKSQNQELKQTLSNNKREYEQLKEQNMLIQAKNHEMNSQIQAKNFEIENLKNINLNLVENNSSLSKQNVDFEKRISIIQSEKVSNSEYERKMLIKQNTELTNQILDSNNKISKLQVENQKLKYVCKSYLNEEKKAKAISLKNQELKNKLFILQEKNKQLCESSKNVENIKDENIKLKSIIDQLEKENKLLKENPTSKIINNDQLLEETLKIQIMNLNTQNHELDKKLKASKEENKINQKNIQNLIQQNKALISKITELNNCLTERANNDHSDVLRKEIENVSELNTILNNKCNQLHLDKIKLLQVNSKLSLKLRKADNLISNINLKFNQPLQKNEFYNNHLEFEKKVHSELDIHTQSKKDFPLYDKSKICLELSDSDFQEQRIDFNYSDIPIIHKNNSFISFNEI